VSFIFNTNAIEGSPVTYKDTDTVLRGGKTKAKAKDAREIKNMNKKFAGLTGNTARNESGFHRCGAGKMEFHSTVLTVTGGVSARASSWNRAVYRTQIPDKNPKYSRLSLTHHYSALPKARLTVLFWYSGMSRSPVLVFPSRVSPDSYCSRSRSSPDWNWKPQSRFPASFLDFAILQRGGVC
jgi:hypothetical protein